MGVEEGCIVCALAYTKYSNLMAYKFVDFNSMHIQNIRRLEPEKVGNNNCGSRLETVAESCEQFAG